MVCSKVMVKITTGHIKLSLASLKDDDVEVGEGDCSAHM
jgi:hypothetical protein